MSLCMLKISRDFSGGPVLRFHTSTAGGADLILDQGTKIPQAL